MPAWVENSGYLSERRDDKVHRKWDLAGARWAELLTEADFTSFENVAQKVP